MSTAEQKGTGTTADPWVLLTPPGTSEYTMHRAVRDGVEVIVCAVGTTVLLYDARCLDELHAMLREHGDWMELGSTDEQKPAKDGTVEAWGRSADNPRGGWYGLKKGLRGRFGMYVPPLMERLGLAEGGAQPTQQPHARDLTRIAAGRRRTLPSCDRSASATRLAADPPTSSVTRPAAQRQPAST